MRILLTGATGFVGSHLFPALEAAGCDVLCGTRNPSLAKSKYPNRHWGELDVESRESVRSALTGCDAAFYLVHGMGQGSDYPEREARSASYFSEVANSIGVKRVVYLGGVLPTKGRSTKHLRSRRATGEILRSGQTSTIEMRAAMIIGEGSISWMMVRDLADRLPFMLLPSWLRNHSYPISIDDVVWGLLAGLCDPSSDSRVIELPGPERISHRDVLIRVAALLGHTRPMINVPILSPRLSSYWIALVTRVSLPLAKELVEGVRFDLSPEGTVMWDECDRKPLPLEEAAKLLIQSAGSELSPSLDTLARLKAIGREFESRLQ